MSVTKQDVQQLFPSFIDGKPCFKPEIYQVGHKQLFIATFPTYQLLISYRTIVGYCYKGTWLLTRAKYSRTTSRQLTQFASGKTIGWIEQEYLQERVRVAQGN